MLFLLTGSSCAGKTALARAVAGTLPGLTAHDFDEAGVPSWADPAWRQRTLEQWVQRAVDYQERGFDLLLTGQSPLGELLAAPSAPRVDGIAVCLVDVDDGVRLARLDARDRDRWPPQQRDAFIGWARWHREHAADPRSRVEVLTEHGWAGMRWDRWTGWSPGDPRWHTHVLDTTGATTEESSVELRGWILGERARHAAGRLPLAPGWDH